MAKIFTEECLNVISSKFDLILMAVHRTRELLNEADLPVLQKRYEVHSAEVMALLDISRGKLNIDSLRKHLLDALVSEYHESHLIKFINQQNLDTDKDQAKMLQDIFKDDLPEQDQATSPVSDSNTAVKEEEPKLSSNDLKHEDDVIDKVMQLDKNSS